MYYTIGAIAKRMNVSTHTLRYYDKEGLLPFVERNEKGIRQFKDEDIEWLAIIECLKSSGLAIKNIKTFIDWCMEGDTTIQQRYEMFLERKKSLEQEMAELQKTMDVIDYKCWYYKTALAAGTTSIHTSNTDKLPNKLKCYHNKKQVS